MKENMEGYFSETNKVKDTTLSTAPLISPPPFFLCAYSARGLEPRNMKKGKTKKIKRKW